MVRHEIREVDPGNQKDVAAITRLHLEILSWGPMAKLGELFLRKFCYTVLLRDCLVRAALYKVDGQPVGFVAYTDQSIAFHRNAIRRHWGYVAFLVVISVIRNPHVMFHLWRAFRLMVSRRIEKNLTEYPLAEILAIGVLPQYRTPGFMRRTGLRISEELVKHTAAYTKQAGLTKIRMIVDADNRAALMFYHSLGARFEPYRQAGLPVFLGWLDLENDF